MTPAHDGNAFTADEWINRQNTEINKMLSKNRRFFGIARYYCLYNTRRRCFYISNNIYFDV